MNILPTFWICSILQILTNSGTVKDYFTKILLQDAPGTIIFNTYTPNERKFYEPIPRLQELDIEFYSSDGELYDFIVVTETWLKDSICDAELLSSQYELYRHDQPRHQPGGGALQAVSSRLRSRPLATLPPPIPGCEQAWCLVNLEGGRRLAAGVVYLPPSPDSTTLEHLSAAVGAVRD